MPTPSETADMLRRTAERIGFECIGETDAGNLTVKEEVRDMCAADRCQAFGRNWQCPPACGTLDSFRERIAAFDRCMTVQTVAELEDEFDIEAMMEAAQLHGRRMAQLKTEVAPEEDMLILGAGACTLCPECTYPDEPCRFPDKAIVSMEAAGLVVSDVCTAAGIPYNHGKDRIAYTGCILY